MTGSNTARTASIEPPPDGEEYALYATSALDGDAAAALQGLLHEVDPPVRIDHVACTEAGHVQISYQREGAKPVGDEAAFLCGAYIHAHGEADGSLGGLEATVTMSDGTPRATWCLNPAWIEAHRADRFGDDELMDRVSSTVEVV